MSKTITMRVKFNAPKKKNYPKKKHEYRKRAY